MDRVTTAVIGVGGYGTRRLPITKAIEKCMLPIGNRPLVDYIVADCAKAGIQRIIFITTERDQQLRDYYGHNAALEQYLTTRGKQDALELLNDIGQGLSFEYIRQTADLPIGDGAPLAAARPALTGEERFAVLMGDDFVYRADGTSELADAIAIWQGSTPHLLLSAPIDRQLAPRYGVLAYNDQHHLTRLVEKPSIEEAPDPCIINISKYVFSRSMLDYIDDNIERARQSGTELEIVDVIMAAVTAGEAVYVHDSSGSYLDGGSEEGWLQANRTVLEVY